MYNFGSFDAFIVKPTIMPDFARNLLHYMEHVACCPRTLVNSNFVSDKFRLLFSTISFN